MHAFWKALDRTVARCSSFKHDEEEHSERKVALYLGVGLSPSAAVSFMQLLVGKVFSKGKVSSPATSRMRIFHDE